MRSVYFLRISYLRTKAQPVNVSRLLHETAIYEYIAVYSCFICETRTLSQDPRIRFNFLTSET